MDGRGGAGERMEAPPARGVICSNDSGAAEEAITSALVCRKRSSSVFEEFPHTSTPASKRIRTSAAVHSPNSAASTCSSPVQPSLSPSSSVDHRKKHGWGDHSSPIAHLRFLFPEMDSQILEKAIEASGNNMDSAIKSLNELRAGASGRNFGSSGKASVNMGTNLLWSSDDAAARDLFSAENLPSYGSIWVEIFVREMMNASHMDDARSRTARVLELLEKSIKEQIRSEAARIFQEENKKLKEQVEALLHENIILKRAVAIQHERRIDYNAVSQELQQLKQMVAKYQEQLRTLELNNYTLAMHLRQALQNPTIPGNFHHDVS